MNSEILDLLGDDASFLLDHECKGITKDRLHPPGPDFVDRVFAITDRNNRTLGNLEWIFQHGRLAGTGYVSILPVDQGIEHSGGASFAKNPDYFDPAKIVETADFNTDASDRMTAAIQILDERSRHIIESRWLGENKRTLHDLADQYGISAERVRQIEANAIKKLRNAMAL